jgi:hypothetical protein
MDNPQEYIALKKFQGQTFEKRLLWSGDSRRILRLHRLSSAQRQAGH